MISLFSTSDQKSNADEMLPYLLDNLGFQQNYVPEFTRLALRVIAVAIAGGLFWYERKVTWLEVYPFIVAGVIGYFGLQGVAWAIKKWVEKDAVYLGTKGSKTLYIRTKGETGENKYTVTCEFDGHERSFECKFTDFVDHNGRVVVDKLQPLLAGALKQE